MQVPGSKYKTITAALEDVRPAITDDPFAEAVQDGIDTLDHDIATILDDPQSFPSDPLLIPLDPMDA